MFDTIIIGAGPAGVTAGIYAARKKLKTLLIAKDFLGQIGKTGIVDNWPGSPQITGLDLTFNFEKHLKNFDLTIKEGVEVSVINKKDNSFEVKTKQGDVFESNSLIVCSGGQARKLGIKGEEEFKGKGVSNCSICDAPFFKDKKVAVIGSGNSALEAVLDLTKYASSILLFEREGFLRGDELLQKQIKENEKVEVVLEASVEEIKGKDMVEGIVVSGKEYPLSGIFVEIGYQAQSDFLDNLIEKNAKGEIIINQETGETSEKGIFAAGDCSNLKYKQLIIAAGSGAIAALSCYNYLTSNRSEV
ncbi:FAD-dependent oxidoreductase [Candidatus Parcubacteria bacterium]|nr:FAD-dependent oxidoreductase [Candidatus Parcubacteria bacterium]